MSELRALTELGLRRSVSDGSLYELPGYGVLRAGGYFGGGDVTITVDGATWQCAKVGMWGKRYAATDTTGRIEGTYEGPLFGIGTSTLKWRERRLNMVKTGHPGRARYTLQEHGDALCDLFAVSGNTVPVAVRLRRDDIAPDLLMFAVFVAREMGRRTSGAGSDASAGDAGLEPRRRSSGSGDGGGFFGGDGGSGCSGGGDGGGGGCGGGGCGGGS